MLLTQPIRHIANEIAEKINEYDEVSLTDLEEALRMDENFILMGNDAFSQMFKGFVESKTLHSIAQDTVQIRNDLLDVMRFITTGALLQDKRGRTNFMDYNNHEDGCEIVAEEMADAEALNNGGEISGYLVPDFRYVEGEDKYALKLSPAFVFSSFKGGENIQALRDLLYKELQDITGEKNLAKFSSEEIHLSHEELGRLCEKVYAELDFEDQSLAAFINDIKFEEVLHGDLHKVEQRKERISSSESFETLKQLYPDAEENPHKKLASLSTAMTVISQIIDSPEVQKIRNKYKISEKLVKKDLSALDALGADIRRLQNVIDVHLDKGEISLEDMEAISGEFRETIANGRHVLNILDRSMKYTDGQDKNRLYISHLTQILDESSLAPVNFARRHMSKEGQELAHHLGRHTGQEGADLVGGFSDFIEDFGGEVVEFVNRNKILTLGLGLSFYFLMTAGKAQGGGDDMANTLANAANQASSGLLAVSNGMDIDLDAFMSGDFVVDANAGLEKTVHEMPRDEMERQFGLQAIKACHFHLPVKVPYFEHCLVSDQAIVQLNQGIDLIKGPLNALLDAPADGMNILAPRDPNEAPFMFAENFKTSLRTTGNMWFVANGYQNLAHAPWAAVAASMGYKLGVKEALIRTSGLIRPLVDGAWGIASDNKYLLSTIPAAFYGYNQQGVSGAVMATVLSAGASYAALGTQRGVQGLISRHTLKHAQTNYKRTENILSSADRYFETESGILVPKTVKLDENTQNIFDKTHETALELMIGGEKTSIALSDNMLKELAGFAFLLENLPDKLGIEPPESDPEMLAINKKIGVDKNWQVSTDMPYRDYLLRSTRVCLAALQNYMSGDPLRSNFFELQNKLQEQINIVTGAEMIHLDKDTPELSKRQTKELLIDAYKTKREFARAQATRDDMDYLRKTAFNAGRSLSYMRVLPATTSANLGYKAASVAMTGGKMALRSVWSALRDDALPLLQKKYNAIKDETKGTIIGSFMVLTAAAVTIDANTEAQQTIKDALSFGDAGAELGRIFGEAKDLLGLNVSPQEQKDIIESARILAGTDLPQAVIDGIQSYSGATGAATGASAASGLFAVYNFGEDHLIIHVSMGYICILMGGAGHMAANVASYPLNMAGQAGKYFNSKISDMTKGVIDAKKPVRVMKRELADLKRLSRNIREFDKEYLPSLNAE